MDQKPQTPQTPKRTPDQKQQFPGQQPQRNPGQKPERDYERERKED